MKSTLEEQQAYKIHGIFQSDSEDSSNSDFDEFHKRNKPPPINIKNFHVIKIKEGRRVQPVTDHLHENATSNNRSINNDDYEDDQENPLYKYKVDNRDDLQLDEIEKNYGRKIITKSFMKIESSSKKILYTAYLKLKEDSTVGHDETTYTLKKEAPLVYSMVRVNKNKNLNNENTEKSLESKRRWMLRKREDKIWNKTVPNSENNNEIQYKYALPLNKEKTNLEEISDLYFQNHAHTEDVLEGILKLNNNALQNNLTLHFEAEKISTDQINDSDIENHLLIENVLEPMLKFNRKRNRGMRKRGLRNRKKKTKNVRIQNSINDIALQHNLALYLEGEKVNAKEISKCDFENNTLTDNAFEEKLETEKMTTKEINDSDFENQIPIESVFEPMLQLKSNIKDLKNKKENTENVSVQNMAIENHLLIENVLEPMLKLKPKRKRGLRNRKKKTENMRVQNSMKDIPLKHNLALCFEGGKVNAKEISNCDFENNTLTDDAFEEKLETEKMTTKEINDSDFEKQIPIESVFEPMLQLKSNIKDLKNKKENTENVSVQNMAIENHLLIENVLEPMLKLKPKRKRGLRNRKKKTENMRVQNSMKDIPLKHNLALCFEGGKVNAKEISNCDFENNTLTDDAFEEKFETEKMTAKELNDSDFENQIPTENVFESMLQLKSNIKQDLKNKKKKTQKKFKTDSILNFKMQNIEDNEISGSNLKNLRGNVFCQIVNSDQLFSHGLLMYVSYPTGAKMLELALENDRIQPNTDKISETEEFSYCEPSEPWSDVSDDLDPTYRPEETKIERTLNWLQSEDFLTNTEKENRSNSKEQRNDNEHEDFELSNGSSIISYIDPISISVTELQIDVPSSNTHRKDITNTNLSVESDGPSNEFQKNNVNANQQLEVNVSTYTEFQKDIVNTNQPVHTQQSSSKNSTDRFLTNTEKENVNIIKNKKIRFKSNGKQRSNSKEQRNDNEHEDFELSNGSSIISYIDPISISVTELQIDVTSSNTHRKDITNINLSVESDGPSNEFQKNNVNANQQLEVNVPTYTEFQKDIVNTNQPVHTQQSSSKNSTDRYIDETRSKQKKRIICKFCRISVTNFERHLCRHHLDEIEVKDYLKFPKNTKEGRQMRQNILALLRYEVKFEQYVQTEEFQPDKLPCAHCKRIIAAKYLRIHYKNCIVRPINETGRNIRYCAASQTLLACANEHANVTATLRVKKEVFKNAEENFALLRNDRTNTTAFKKLVDVSLALTILFNRRRIGDVQYVETETYLKNFNASNQTEFIEQLTESEKALTTKYKRVVAGGKGSRAIVILFPPNVQNYINLLLQIRQETEIVPLQNKYLLAYPGVTDQWVRGDIVLKKFANSCKIEHPEAMTSNRLRKQIATLMQIINLDKTEYSQFARFMGHTEKTHQEYYEITQDAFQTAKVAKLVTLFDKGKGTEYRNKTLDNINIDPNNEIAECDDNADNDGEPTASPRYNSISHDKDEGNVADDAVVSRKNKKSNRIRWTAEQKKLVSSHFKKHIKLKQAPKKNECEEFRSQHKHILGALDWVRIKTFVYNEYKDTNKN
ncbi:hypothetical protein FQA39_LY15429 [Lamprigera yunnana]|nr:hypothetical protein FQA39_LY15429 [Lamprigera yunnana]